MPKAYLPSETLNKCLYYSKQRSDWSERKWKAARAVFLHIIAKSLTRQGWPLVVEIRGIPSTNNRKVGGVLNRVDKDA
jgi:hypothetical protein